MTHTINSNLPPPPFTSSAITMWMAVKGKGQQIKLGCKRAFFLNWAYGEWTARQYGQIRARDKHCFRSVTQNCSTCEDMFLHTQINIPLMD